MEWLVFRGDRSRTVREGDEVLLQLRASLKCGLESVRGGEEELQLSNELYRRSRQQQG